MTTVTPQSPQSAQLLPAQQQPWRLVRLLAISQIISYGSLYYAFALLASAIQGEMGWRTEVVFGAFSWSLLVAGLAATPAGALVDRYGGRRVMSAGSVLAGLGMLALAVADSISGYFAAWTVVGVAMAMVLYESAFASIYREFAEGGRRAVSILTLFGGFASTVFWPLTLYLDGAIGWRGVFAVYGLLHLLLCLPLHLLMPSGPKRLARPVVAADPIGRDSTLAEAVRDPAFWRLALAFSANMFIFSALSVHLIPLLQRFGHSVGLVVLMAALIGPLQVAGRMGEMALAHRFAPAAVGRFTFALLPAALLTLLLFAQNQYAAALFCMLYGMSNGIVTIVRGTVPQALFGRENYGAIAGALAGPALLSKAIGPLAIAALIEVAPTDRWLIACLLIVSVVSLVAFVSAVKRRAHIIGALD